MTNGYPNMMCFGNEPDKCGCQSSCSNYLECEDAYHNRWFSFMEERSAHNCRFGEEYPTIPYGKTIVGCTEDNIWCNDCIAARCEQYDSKG